MLCMLTQGPRADAGFGHAAAAYTEQQHCLTSPLHPALHGQSSAPTRAPPARCPRNQHFCCSFLSVKGFSYPLSGGYRHKPVPQALRVIILFGPRCYLCCPDFVLGLRPNTDPRQDMGRMHHRQPREKAWAVSGTG